MCSASAARIVHSTAVSLITGSIPGMPWQIGQTCVLGAASAYCAGQRQNILLAVLSCECTSSPITVSNSPAPSGADAGAVAAVWVVGGEVIVASSYRASGGRDAPTLRQTTASATLSPVVPTDPRPVKLAAMADSVPADSGAQVLDAGALLPPAAHPHSVRLIHTSDVHVGTGYTRDGSGREEALHFLETIMGAAVDLEADLVLIAGDFFDHNRLKEPIVAETAAIISATHVPVVILPGNHDPFMPGSMYERFRHHFADHVHIFDDADGTLLSLDDVGVQIWGQAHTSYDDFSPAGSSPGWRSDSEQPLWRIAMAHGSAVGFDGPPLLRLPHRGGAPLRPRAHYVALGHLDRHGQTGPPGTTAFYSGAPSLLKGFTLVDLRPHASTSSPSSSTPWSAANCRNAEPAR